MRARGPPPPSSQVVERMRELSEYFTGEKALTRVARDEMCARRGVGAARCSRTALSL